MANQQKATDAAGKATDAAGKAIDSVVNLKVGTIEPYVMCAECCTVNAIGLDYPNCIGCSSEGICCACIVAKADACKPGPADSDVICLGNAAACMCVKPGTVLCKSKQQCFCCDSRCALPCDEDVPFSCVICFVQLFRHNEFTTAIKPEIQVLPRATSLAFEAPAMPSIART